MRERAFLVAAIVVLLGGLGVWATVAERGRPNAAILRSRPAAPSIGVRVGRDDARATTVRRTLERAMLGDAPVLELFARSSVPVHGIVVPGSDAIGVRDRLAAVAAQSGRWPVVIGDGWDVRAHLDATHATLDPPEAILARARGVDLDAWIAARLERLDVPIGEWPADAQAEPRERFRTVRDRDVDLPRAAIAIALLPVRDPSEAPAWLAFGNWPGCPGPTQHVALLARWRDRFGAELVAIGSDTIELRVARPPADRESALALAREHVAYAPALLDGGRSLRDLAAAMIGAPVWTFRWPRAGAAH